MMWVNKQDPRAIYFDRRNEDYEIKPNAAYPNGTTLKVRPDVQGDFGAMPFPDDSFKLVVFDPPHFTQIGMTGVLGMTYGKLFPDWEDGIEAGFRECFRVLKPQGVLIFKWCSVQVPLDRVLALAPHPPLFGHNTGHRAQTHWMTFMKPGQEEVIEMHLCEVPMVMLRPNQEYRFTVDPNCEKCAVAAKPYSSESQRKAAAKADEKPDGQAENA